MCVAVPVRVLDIMPGPLPMGHVARASHLVRGQDSMTRGRGREPMGPTTKTRDHVRRTGEEEGLEGHTSDDADDQVPCCFAYVPQARVGDYVIVQNGFAIDLLDPVSAAESLAAFAELAELIPGPPPAV